MSAHVAIGGTCFRLWLQKHAKRASRFARRKYPKIEIDSVLHLPTSELDVRLYRLICVRTYIVLVFAEAGRI